MGVVDIINHLITEEQKAPAPGLDPDVKMQLGESAPLLFGAGAESQDLGTDLGASIVMGVPQWLLISWKIPCYKWMICWG